MSRATLSMNWRETAMSTPATIPTPAVAPVPASNDWREQARESRSPSPTYNRNNLNQSDFGNNIKAGSILFLPNSTTAKESCIGRQINDGAYGHPVLVTRITSNYLEILQCTSFGDRGSRAEEIDYSKYIHIDIGHFGSQYFPTRLSGVNLPSGPVRSVFRKSTFANRQPYRFKLEAFTKFNTPDGKIPQLNSTLFDYVFNRMYY